MEWVEIGYGILWIGGFYMNSSCTFYRKNMACPANGMVIQTISFYRLELKPQKTQMLVLV